MVSDSSFNDFLTGALSAPPRTFLAFSNAELNRVKHPVDTVYLRVELVTSMVEDNNIVLTE